MEKTLKELSGGLKIKFKPYTISDIPKSFDKDKHLWFNKDGLTWIEKIDNPLWENL